MWIKEWLILLLILDSGIEPTHACDCWKIYIKRKRESLEVRTCTFEKKTHSTRSSWKRPKDNYDNRVHMMLVAQAWLLRSPFESKGCLCCLNSFGISPCHQVSAGSTYPWHYSMTLNQESFTWSYWCAIISSYFLTLFAPFYVLINLNCQINYVVLLFGPI